MKGKPWVGHTGYNKKPPQGRQPCGGKQGMKVVRRSIPFHYIIIWEESQLHGKSNTRAAAGAGSIRQRADGSWEGRCVTGYDPGTGKPLRRSVYAKTQKEARKKLAEIIALVDTGAYQAPCRITVGEWLDIWADTYLGGCKARTVVIYKDDIRLHIKPALAAIQAGGIDHAYCPSVL